MNVCRPSRYFSGQASTQGNIYLQTLDDGGYFYNHGPRGEIYELCVCMHVCVCMYACVYTDLRVVLAFYVCMYVSIRLYVYIFICLYIYIYIYIYI